MKKSVAIKKKSLNKYDIPSTGHVAGETLLQACLRNQRRTWIKEWLNQKRFGICRIKTKEE